MPTARQPASSKTSTQAARQHRHAACANWAAPTVQRRLPHDSSGHSPSPAGRQHRPRGLRQPGGVDRTATLAGCQRQSCAIAGRTTVPAAQQRRLHRNARHTAAPARGGTSWSATPIGRGNTYGQVFHLAPSFEGRTRGRSLKCVGFNRMPQVDLPFRNLFPAVSCLLFRSLLSAPSINPTHFI